MSLSKHEKLGVVVEMPPSIFHTIQEHYYYTPGTTANTGDRLASVVYYKLALDSFALMTEQEAK